MGVAIFYAVTIGFACGVGVASLLTPSFSILLFILLIALGLMAVGIKHPRAIVALRLCLVSFFLLAAALGGSRLLWAELSVPVSQYDTVLGTEQVISGAVIREPDRRERTIQLTVETSEGTVLVRADRHAEVAYGDTITATGTLERPQSFTTEFGRTFDYPGYLKAQGITHTLSFADVTVTDSGGGAAYLRGLLAVKQRFMTVLESVIAEPQVGLGEGLLLGVKQALGEDLEAAFRETGIIHIVVLSGYNVMLVVAFVLYILAFILPLRARLVVGLGAIVSFALLVGLSATVVRASIMAALLLIARTFGRIYLLLRALVLAAVIMLLVNPYLLVFDVGFQLSFMATLGLILLAPAVEARLNRVPSTFGVREFLTATLVTQLFVSPLLLYQIGQFSIVSVIVNVLVLPMVPVAMLLTFLTGVLGFISTGLASVVAIGTHASLTYIIAVSTLFAKLPLAFVVVPPFPFWLVIVSYAGLAGFLYWWYTKHTPTEPSLEEWVIEEEDVLIARMKAADESDDSSAALPSFFR